MTKLEMKFDFQRKMRRFRRKDREELEQEIANFWAKWAIRIAAGGVTLGMLAGLSIARLGI